MSEHGHTPGDFPEIHDEAPATPKWVPLLGLGILVVLSLVAVYREATAPEEPVEAVQAAGVELEAEPAAE